MIVNAYGIITNFGIQFRLVVIAGNVLPIDILCHMPAVCEDKNIPYIFVPDKADLGAASGVMGIVQILLLLKDPEYEELYEKVVDCIENWSKRNLSPVVELFSKRKKEVSRGKLPQIRIDWLEGDIISLINKVDCTFKIQEWIIMIVSD
ncbi:H/ACA ribonucleoprotein complex subunit 2-like protein [Armadillidium vulgare]|nr:H/ACA ribonucleoprotein complex subunit 2-like protein [Armadillidium vulgare]